MRISKNAHPPVRQNEVGWSVSQKHDVNLQKNSTLYFQIGLIVCLLATYGLLEMQFKAKTFDISERIELVDESTEYTLDNFKVYEESSLKEEIQPLKKVQLPESFDVVDDDKKIHEGLEIVTDPQPTSNPPINPGDVEVDLIDEDVPQPINFVEQAPIYPGCEKKITNDERRECMSDKINKLIKKKFNTDIGPENGLSGIQKIAVQFKIDKTGNVTDIKTRAPHPKLEQEAERVIGKIPQMTPGKQSNKNVSVIYQLPIKFQVQD